MILLNANTPVLYTANLVYHCYAAPATSSDGGKPLSQFQQAANFSNVGLFIDDHPHFSMRVEPQPNTHIDAISMLFVAVEALATIALQGSRGRTPMTLFYHPLVDFELIPKYPATEVMNEVAILCIYYGVENMARLRDYRESYLGCEWDHVEVATIRIGDRDSRYRAKQTHDGVDDLPIPPTIAIPAGFLRTDDQPYFSYPHDASPLDITAVFITVMNALMRLSWMSSTDRVGPCWTEAGPAWDASIILRESNPPRRQPLILEVRWVLKSLRLVPDYMRRNGRWAEL
ncbi:MAG: hypothetical protein Q9226_006590, partial [Calogaya cf. arnoldii]